MRIGWTTTHFAAVLLIAMNNTIAAPLADETFASISRPAEQNAQALNELLEAIRAKHNVPALAAGSLRGDDGVELGATGTRRSTTDERITTADPFHLGSCTKAMTATLAAILVEEEVIKWETTIADALPQLAPKIDEKYHAVTLRDLLAHRSGLPEDRTPDPAYWPQVIALDGPLDAQRLKLAEIALNRTPASKRGERTMYSNFGYVVAAAIMEQKSGQTWESLIRTKLFEPLGMTRADFGPPASPRSNSNASVPAGESQNAQVPWGHITRGGLRIPIPPGPGADNPAVLRPAGGVHAPLEDWARFITLHLKGGRGEKTEILKPESFAILHGIAGDDDDKNGDANGNPLGWIAFEREWAGGRALMHTGSNTMWYAVVWIAPKTNRAYFAATNIGDQSGFAACDEAISAMITSAQSK